MPRVHHLDLVALTGILVGGYPIFREAIADILQGRMTMELSMTIALVAASAIGEFMTALVIALFVLVAEILEGMTVGRGRRAIRGLLDVLPQIAEIRVEGQVSTRPLSDMRAGDLVVVRPGGHIPADGVVVSGHSFVDQATITGESLPVEKTPGARVFAGTINHSGVLEIQAERVGADTAFGRIIEAVERAENSRAPIQRLADRLAGYLVYFALGCAVLTWFVTHNARSTISVIVVAGACGIAAGTPLAILGAIGRAARLGAIIKGGLYLEILSTVDTVVLDKTGTLTMGTPKVLEADREAVRIAATAERFSEHPLAKAIVAQAAEWSLPVGEPANFRYLPGKGILCEVDGLHTAVGTRALMHDQAVEVPDPDDNHRSYSEVLVAQAGRYVGAVKIVDVLRPEAAQAIKEMKALGCRTVVLTGDRKEVGHSIATKLGVDEVDSELLPEGKVGRVLEVAQAGAARGHGRGRGERRPGAGRSQRRRRHGVGHGRGARERVGGAAGQRSAAPDRSPQNCPPLPPHHLRQFRRHAGGGRHRRGAGRGRAAESDHRRVDPRGVGTGIHPELGTAAARARNRPRKRSGHSCTYLKGSCRSRIA